MRPGTRSAGAAPREWGTPPHKGLAGVAPLHEGAGAVAHADDRDADLVLRVAPGAVGRGVQDAAAVVSLGGQVRSRFRGLRFGPEQPRAVGRVTAPLRAAR